MDRQTKRLFLALFLAIIITTLALVLMPAGAGRQVPAFLLLWIWPALTWGQWLPGNFSERFVIAAGSVLLANAYLALLVSFIPGPVPSSLILAGAVLVAVAPLLILVVKPVSKEAKRVIRPGALFVLMAILLLALFLRLPNLGYKELQGDEGVIMVRAAAVLTGDEAELFVHQKGPAEILVPVGAWALTGATNDLWARLPFAWAGLLSVLAIYWLARRWFSHRVGAAAALFFAIGGFGIAFSRVVQYQSLVVLWGALSLLAAVRYGRERRTADLFLSVVLLAGGMLAHYDAILYAPAVAWTLVGADLRRWRFNWRGWALSLFAGAAMGALFYVPFALHPTFEKTFAYLVGDRVGLSGGAVTLGWGGAPAWQMSTFYNSIWYVVGLILLSAAGLLLLARRKTHFATFLYFAVPAAFYLLLVRDPRTHVYTIFPGAAVLAALGFGGIWERIRGTGNRPLAVVAAICAAAWLLIVTLYPFLLFIDVTPERQRNWAMNRPSPVLYPVTWSEPPEYGLFGFPHQAGWRAARALIPAEGFPYGSNEEEEITNWYMAQAPRTHCANFQTFVLVENAQDSVPYDFERLEGLNLQGKITVNGRSTMELYGSGQADSIPVIEATGVTQWLRPIEVAPSITPEMQPLEVTLGEDVRLLGYKLDTTEAVPGGKVLVTLYWEALRPIDRNKQVFVHLYDGELLAQHDGAPECAINPTTRWEPGQIIPDPHIVDLPPNMKSGPVSLRVGMYDLLSGERLAVDGAGDDTINLTEITISEG